MAAHLHWSGSNSSYFYFISALRLPTKTKLVIEPEASATPPLTYPTPVPFKKLPPREKREHGL